MSISLSVIIISKNSSYLLYECLSSVNWADEVILLDSGSNDDTLQIAYDAGVQVFINEDWHGYGIQRQRAQNLATRDYILMLDTDEIVTFDLKVEIQKILNGKLNPYMIYRISRQNFFLGRFMRYSGFYPDYVVRLYPRRYYRYNDNIVHESLKYHYSTPIKTLNGHLLHLTCLDFFEFQHKQLNYAKLWAYNSYKHNKRVSLLGIFIRTFVTFIKILFLRKGFLDGKQGWLLSIINAQYTFNKYTGLWALNNGFFKGNVNDEQETMY